MNGGIVGVWNKVYELSGTREPKDVSSLTEVTRPGLSGAIARQ
jgi:hypothetical protein